MKAKKRNRKADHKRTSKQAMNVSKKQFLYSVNEWCWEGNGRNDLTTDYGAFLPEVVCATYTAWLEEWVKRFNAMENGFNVKLIIDGNYYRIRRIIVKDIKFPVWDDIKEEEYVVEKEKAGPISVESCLYEDEEEEEEDSDDEEDFEDCEECGYSHHCEDKCPKGARCGLYEKWRK